MTVEIKKGRRSVDEMGQVTRRDNVISDGAILGTIEYTLGNGTPVYRFVIARLAGVWLPLGDKDHPELIREFLGEAL